MYGQSFFIYKISFVDNLGLLLLSSIQQEMWMTFSSVQTSPVAMASDGVISVNLGIDAFQAKWSLFWCNEIDSCLGYVGSLTKSWHMRWFTHVEDLKLILVPFDLGSPLAVTLNKGSYFGPNPFKSFCLLEAKALI